MCNCQNPSTHVLTTQTFYYMQIIFHFLRCLKRTPKSLKLFYEPLCGLAASLISVPIPLHLILSTPERRAFLLLLEHTKWSPNAETMPCWATVWEFLLPGSYMVYFSTSIRFLHKCHLSRETSKPSCRKLQSLWPSLPSLPYPASLSQITSASGI